MPQVRFLPSQDVITVEAGTELLVAAREAGVEIEAPCGGKGTCGKCIVKILDGDVDSDSLGVLPAESVAEGYVLACKTQVLSSDITVEVPEIRGRVGGKISEEDETYLVRTELLPKEWEFNPLAIKWLFQIPEPQLEDGLSDLDRLTRAIQAQWGKRELHYPLGVIQQASEVLRAENGTVTVDLILDHELLQVIRLEPGDTTTHHYAVAVDIGTTTIAVQLVDLTLGRILATRSDYNDQVTCGLDVISRINYARKPERLKELTDRVLGTINTLLDKVCRSHDVDPIEICNMVISGNTTMTHLLLGLPPEHIRLEPYTPTVLEIPYLTAREVGVNICPESLLVFSPNVGSYVGGDITAGLLCTDLATETDEVSLFIDIGTNGELVVGNADFLMTCACSAGPAFEGGGIDCGMRAAVGAIEAVAVDAQTGAPTLKTIGNAAPQGICGSGMIDLIANLITTGWLDAAGRFNRDSACDFIQDNGKRARYILAPAEESGTGKALTIDELDIENIVRAKAAIYSACAL
ncbi:MAG: ASKHA domain-containing protein, partial [Planctomycetota bacterium]